MRPRKSTSNIANLLNMSTIGKRKRSITAENPTNKLLIEEKIY